MARVATEADCPESSPECEDSEFDFTAYGAECCDAAWTTFSIDCAPGVHMDGIVPDVIVLVMQELSVVMVIVMVMRLDASLPR